MELLQLRYFHSAALLENFSKVAEKYFIPQSSISKTIAKLEEELNTKLFDRHGKRITLNENGRVFFQHVNTALSSLDTAIADFTGSRSEKIHMSICAGSKLMPGLLSDFQKKHPNISFSLVLHKQRELEDADCYIMSLPISEHLSYRTLMTEEIMLAVPVTHPLATQNSVTADQIRDENFISFSKHKSMRQITDAYCKHMGFTPKVIFECDDSATFRGLVENNLGIAFVPSKTWSRTASDFVKLLHIEGQVFERTLVIAWNKHKPQSAGLKLFVEFCEGYRK